LRGLSPALASQVDEVDYGDEQGVPRPDRAPRTVVVSPPANPPSHPASDSPTRSAMAEVTVMAVWREACEEDQNDQAENRPCVTAPASDNIAR